MKRVLTLTIVLLVFAEAPSAQEGDPGLVSTWTLVAVDKNVASGEPTRIRGPRGLLVLDGAGHVFEFFTTLGRDEPEAPQQDPVHAFETFGGFWGRYAADRATGTMRFEAFDGVSPDVQSLEFSRSYELDGDRLVVTSTEDEPQAQGDTRWTWQRVPVVEHLTPAYREVVGFWEHIEEGRLNETTGEILSATERAPSLIVYTPSGFVGVHFPSRPRERFAGATPTQEEAQAGLRSYLGYFGTLNVYPGEVSHNLLAGVSPGTGSILRRYADIDGDELVVRLQGGFAQDDDGPRIVTYVNLHRLSGVEDMLPR